MTKEIQGTLAIATSQSGAVYSATDFGRSKSAGIVVPEAQEYRASIRLYREIIRAHCSGDLAKAITSSDYLTESVIQKLLDIGWRFDVQTIMVPGPEEDQ